jgi:hypothetical protein
MRMPSGQQGWTPLSTPSLGHSSGTLSSMSSVTDDPLSAEGQRSSSGGGSGLNAYSLNAMNNNGAIDKSRLQRPTALVRISKSHSLTQAALAIARTQQLNLNQRRSPSLLSLHSAKQSLAAAFLCL